MSYLNCEGIRDRRREEEEILKSLDSCPEVTMGTEGK